MKPLTPEASALRYLRMRELNRQAQQRSRGTDMQSVPSSIASKAPWVPAAVRALMKKRAIKQSNDGAMKWKATNPDVARMVGSLSQHALRGVGVVKVEDWKSILELFGHRCGYCGVQDRLMIEHVTPLGSGGKHVTENIVPACGSCNFVKGKRGPLSMVNRHYAMRLA